MNENSKRKSIWDNKILWAIISIISSILLWVYVTTVEGDRIRETYSGVPVVFSGADIIRERDGFVITDNSVSSVTVILEGTRRDLTKFSASELTATVDVSKITSTGHNTSSLSVGFPTTVNDSAIDVISINPSNVSFVVDRMDTKTIDVKGIFNGSVAEGYTAGDITINPETITVRGPENELAMVDHALVTIEREDVNKSLSFESTYVLMDKEGEEVPLGNLVLDRETVTVNFKVTITKEVPLSVDLVEGAGASSKNVSVNCDPDTITIAGDPAELEGINRISLGTVNLASFESTYENTFTVTLPDDVTNVTGITTVKVTIRVEGLETKYLTVTNLSVVGVTQGYVGTATTMSRAVLLRGAPEDLDKLQANNVRLVADAGELGEATGEFEVPAKVHVDGVTGVGAIGEYTVFIKIKRS